MADSEKSHKKKRAPRNRTIELSEEDRKLFRKNVVFADEGVHFDNCADQIVCGDAFDVLSKLPADRFDLLFADPPYNLTKDFGTNSFKQTSLEEYETWLNSWLKDCANKLKPTASIYICGDWRSSAAIQRVGMNYFTLRNRITWEREKGRGAKANWKNSSEDIWFFTVSDEYTFNLDNVKMKRKVVAPYTENGKPKDWEKSERWKLPIDASFESLE